MVQPINFLKLKKERKKEFDFHWFNSKFNTIKMLTKKLVIFNRPKNYLVQGFYKSGININHNLSPLFSFQQKTIKEIKKKKKEYEKLKLKFLYTQIKLCIF